MISGLYGPHFKKKRYTQEVNSSDNVDTAQAASSSSAPAAKAGAKQSKQQQPYKASKTHILSELEKASKIGVLHGEALKRYHTKMTVHAYSGSLGKGKPFTLSDFDVEDLRTMYRMHVYGKKPP
jgi:hypothetical protein